MDPDVYKKRQGQYIFGGRRVVSVSKDGYTTKEKNGRLGTRVRDLDGPSSVSNVETKQGTVLTKGRPLGRFRSLRGYPFCDLHYYSLHDNEDGESRIRRYRRDNLYHSISLG